MSQGDQKSLINQEEKDKMLDDLESLSQMLDDDPDAEADSQIIPEDIPVLKSFVDDVPVLNESMDNDAEEEPPAADSEAGAGDAEPPTLQATDTIDLNAASFNTHPAGHNNSGRQQALDMSFLDKDPLDISERVRSYRQNNTQGSVAESHPTVAPAAEKAEPIAPNPPQPAKAEEVTRPLNRFQTSSGSENPFLPRSTLDKIRENHAWEQNRGQDNDASAQLRKLLQDNPLNRVTFDTGSKEAQALRQKASQLVNEVIRANMPRLEAELRMKLEQEVDRMFKEIKKNPR